MFYDVMNSPVDEFKSLEEEFAQFNDYMEVFELVNIRESGYPDVLDYEGNGAVVISWWDMTFRNKKSGNTSTIKQHIQHSFNEKGEIWKENIMFSGDTKNLIMDEDIKTYFNKFYFSKK